MPTAFSQELGWVVILNGTPRSGKSSIAKAMQERGEGVWVNLGVDIYQQAVPSALQPSIGLRPGGERPDLEPHLPVLFAALYESIAAHSRLGLNVVVDIGHHDSYTRPLHLLGDCVRRLRGLPVLIVGVRCPIDIILERRSHTHEGREGLYARRGADGRIPEPILRWQDGVHEPGIYDLELDTSALTPEAAAAQIGELLQHGVPKPTAAVRIIQSAG